MFAASRDLDTHKPVGATVAGVELVAWRDPDGRLTVGPGACPHLGAPLASAALDCECIALSLARAAYRRPGCAGLGTVSES